MTFYTIGSLNKSRRKRWGFTKLKGRYIVLAFWACDLHIEKPKGSIRKLWELILIKVQDTKINILKYHIYMSVMDSLEKKRTVPFITTTTILVKDLTKKRKDPYKENTQMLLKEIVKNTWKSKKIHVHRSEEKTLLNWARFLYDLHLSLLLLNIWKEAPWWCKDLFCLMV